MTQMHEGAGTAASSPGADLSLATRTERNRHMPNTWRCMHITETTSLIDGNFTTETPDGSLDGLDVLLGRIGPNVHRDGCTVILGGNAPALLGFPKTQPRRPRPCEALDAARTIGWRVSDLNPWMTFWRPGRPSIHIGLEPWLSGRNFPLMAADPIPTQRRLFKFHRWLGVPFHGKTAGLAGVELLRDHHAGTSPMWCPEWEGIEPAHAAGVETVTAGWRSTYPEHVGNYEHEFDARLQFLSAAINVEVAVDRLRRIPAHGGGFDPARPWPGYYLVDVPPWRLDDRMPHPIGNHAPGTRAWITGATLALLHEIAEEYQVIAMPAILDGWVDVRGGKRVMRVWGERIRDAIKAARGEGEKPADPVLYDQVKQVYKSAIGLIQTGSGRVRRPDWAHAVIGKARSNFWRKMWDEGTRRGRWPVEINADAVWYRSQTTAPEWPFVPEDPSRPHPNRQGPGGFRHQNTREATT